MAHWYSDEMKKHWAKMKRKSKGKFCVYHFYYDQKEHKTKGDLTTVLWGGIGVSPDCSEDDIWERYEIELREIDSGAREIERHWLTQFRRWKEFGKVKCRILFSDLTEEDAKKIEYMLRNEHSCQLKSCYVWNTKEGG